jgi:hypothetical protein
VGRVTSRGVGSLIPNSILKKPLPHIDESPECCLSYTKVDHQREEAICRESSIVLDPIP